MLSQKSFIETINRWDDIFPRQTLEQAYKNLSSAVEKKYLVCRVDNINMSATVEQASEAELRNGISETIRAYRESEVSYIPRILILDLESGTKIEDPTQWGQFLLSVN